MYYLQALISTVLSPEISPMAAAGLVPIVMIILWGIVKEIKQAVTSRNQSWYKKRCNVLSQRLELNKSERKLLKYIRNAESKTFRLVPGFRSL